MLRKVFISGLMALTVFVGTSALASAHFEAGRTATYSGTAVAVETSYGTNPHNYLLNGNIRVNSVRDDLAGELTIEVRYTGDSDNFVITKITKQTVVDDAPVTGGGNPDEFDPADTDQPLPAEVETKTYRGTFEAIDDNPSDLAYAYVLVTESGEEVPIYTSKDYLDGKTGEVVFDTSEKDVNGWWEIILMRIFG